MSVRSAISIVIFFVAADVNPQNQASLNSNDPECLPSSVAMKQALMVSANAPLDSLEETVIKALVLDPTLFLQPLTIYYSRDIDIAAVSPYATFRVQLQEAIRKREPVSSIEFPSGIAIAVSPSTINAPDVIKLIVERDGKEIPPIQNGLEPRILTTRAGLTTTLHAGILLFPCSAFMPGARVTVTAIPESGANMAKTIGQSDLVSLTGVSR
jgi:hypothetical protein